MGSHARLCISLRIRTLLVLFFSVIASAQRDSSEQNEVETSDSDSYKSDIQSVSSKKYVMESYFERYESLIDSNFEEFIARESSLGLCNFPSGDVRVSVLNRSLDGEGAHRRLSSSITLNIMPESLTDFSGRSCEVVFIERLPSGVFADPFELQHLVQHGVFTDVGVFGDTNLELPTAVTNRSVVEIHMNVESINLYENELEIKIELPLHSRYPPLNDSGYTEVVFGSPDLLMRYTQSIKHGTSNDKRCLIFPAKHSATPETGNVVWRVPSGREPHTEVVSVVTFICALISTLVIFFTSIYHTDTKTVKLS